MDPLKLSVKPFVTVTSNTPNPSIPLMALKI